MIADLQSFLESVPGRVWGALAHVWEELWEEHSRELAFALFGVASAVVRALGVTIRTGSTGVLFSFGRARRELQPGFHLLIPFLQVAPRIATRQRTLLPVETAGPSVVFEVWPLHPPSAAAPAPKRKLRRCTCPLLSRCRPVAA